MTAIFIMILNMSITASIVALAVMLARIPLRKSPKIFSYVLWGVVLFRLVFPISIESIFSLMPTSANVIQHDIFISYNPTIQTGLPFIDEPINATFYNALPLIESGTNPIMIVTIAGYVWLLGFIALMIYAIIGYAKLRRRVYFATLVRDNIFESDRIKSPFVFGFIRPKIYFPVGIDQMDYIVKHEQTHIKRRDYLIKPFAYIVFALHWFNPIMWLSYFLMSKDMEMSCDEAVLRKTTEDIRSEYSTTLLNLAAERVSLLNPIAFSFGESNVKERVVNVLSFKKRSKWVIVVSLVAIAVFIVGFASNRVNVVAVEMLDNSQIQIAGEWNEWLVWFNSLSSEQQARVSLRPPIENIANITSERPILQSPTIATSEEEARFSAERDERLLAQRITHFEMYREFGLIFNPTSNHLYFNGELVRYFTDMIPLSYTSNSAGASFGMTHFAENGTVDVRAVRDFSQMVLQGTIDLTKGLLGVEAFTQVEFNARNIDALTNSAMGLSPQVASSNNGEYRYAGSGAMVTATDPNLSIPPRRPSAEVILEYEEWGLTFEGFYSYHGGGFMAESRQNVFFNGKLVGGLSDFSNYGMGMSISSNDRSGNGWIHVIRDENGLITELDIRN